MLSGRVRRWVARALGRGEASARRHFTIEAAAGRVVVSDHRGVEASGATYDEAVSEYARRRGGSAGDNRSPG